MLTNHLKVFYRKANRFKSAFLINMLGLCSALACALLIYLWIDDELHVDKFLDDERVVYQIMEHTQTPNGIETTDRTPQILSDKLAAEFPEVLAATVVTPVQWFPKFVIKTDQISVKGSGKFAGKDFFKTFSIQLLEGMPETAMSELNSIVISQSLAGKLFQDPALAIGKTITWEIPGLKSEAIVTGIYRDLPTTASEKFDFLLAFDFLRTKLGLDMKTFDYGPQTFLSLQSHADLEEFNKKIAGFIGSQDPAQTNRKLFATKYSDNYLFGVYENGQQTGGRIYYVRLFALVGVLVILIACINFTNLSTAKNHIEIKGVGIRRIVGANKKTLISQFLTESLGTSVLALILALMFVAMVLHPFSIVSGKDLTLQTRHILPLLGIAVVTGLAAGIYPALSLAFLKPLSAIKGTIKTNFAELAVRKGLVVFQFALSVIFIVIVGVIYKQIQFIQSKNLGFAKNDVIVFEAANGTMQQVESLITEIKNTSGVENASSMWGNLVTGFENNATLSWNGAAISVAAMNVNQEFLETIGVKFEEGKSFSPSSSTEYPEIILNKKAIDLIGMTDPIQKLVSFQGTTMKIIGVTENFHFQSLYSSIMPLAIRLQNDRSWTIVARLKTDDRSATIDRLGKVFEKHNDGLTFEYRSLNDDFEKHYASEERVYLISQFAAGLAILVSSLGLVGLASFVTQRKKKEIGIRKILGATVQSIIVFITSDFLLLVVVAIVLGLPIGYWISDQWLTNFAYRITLDYSFFAIAALLALTTSFIAVCSQALKASLTNPSDSLRQE